MYPLGFRDCAIKKGAQKLIKTSSIKKKNEESIGQGKQNDNTFEQQLLIQTILRLAEHKGHTHERSGPGNSEQKAMILPMF